MPHYRTTTITGSELIPGFLDGTRIFLTRPQVISLLAATEVSSPVPFRKATAPSSASRVVAVQGGVLTNFDRTEFATYLAATGTPDPVPAGRGVSSITGRERIEGMQGNTRVGLDVSEAVDFRDNTDLSNSLTPSWIANPANNLLVSVGDSRPNAMITVSADNIQQRNLGVHHWVAQKLGQRFQRNYGDYATGGATDDNVINGTGTAGSEWGGLDAALVASGAKTCRLIAGVNTWTLTPDDPASCAAQLVTSKAIMQTAIQISYNRQCRLIAGEYPSSIYGATGMTANRQQLSSDYDDWLKTLPAQYPWVFYANSYRAVAVNPTGPTDILAAASYDRKHFQTYGAWLAAQAEAAVYQTLFPSTQTVFPMFTSASVAYDPSTAPQGSLLANWMLDDGGVDSAVPTGWAAPTASGLTYTWSRVAGKKRLTVTGAAASSGFATFSQAIPASSILLNDKIQLSAKMAILPGSTGLVAAVLQTRFTIGGVNKYRSDLDSGGATLGGVNNLVDGITASGQMLTPPTDALNAGADYTLRSAQIALYHLAGQAVNTVIEFDDTNGITCRKV